MDRPGFYEFRIEGHLSERWSSWLEGLEIRNQANQETVLSGFIRDQSALVGMIGRIHALNLTLISVRRLPAGQQAQEAG